MRWMSGARRVLTLRRGTWGGPGSRWWGRAGVSAAVGVVVLVAVVVGVATGVVDPSRAGAAGLLSDAFGPSRTSTVTGPCEVYGWHELRDRRLELWPENRWVDRVPTWRGAGREIVFADENAVYAVSVDGTQLWRPVREDTAVFHVGGRSRYVLKGFTSLDVSNVDGALVYATCWSYSPDGSDPEIARCAGPGPVPQDCFQKPPHSGKVRLAYPAGDVDFDIGDDLYELTVVRPDEGTVTRLYLGNFPAWSPDGRRIAFVSAYWRTVGGPAPPRVTRYDRLAPAGSDLQSRVQIMAADGTDLQTVYLPPGRHAEFPPRWSPDGTRLALLVIEEDPTLHYETSGDATFAIYTVGADGTGLERLAEARSNPAWSPDGTRLAFAKASGDQLHLYTMAADGADVRQITAAPGAVIQPGVAWVPGLAWSPDGSRLLYRCFVLVCVVGLGGQMVGEFPDPYLGAQIPAWSADGRRIVLYNAANAGRDKVVLTSIAPDGSDGRVLVRAGADGRPVADPAGSLLLPGPVADPAVCRAGVVVPAPAQHPGLVADCAVLVALRPVLFGRAATNWTANTPLAEWKGVMVGGAPGIAGWPSWSC